MFRTDEAVKCTHDKDANKLGLVGVLANAPTRYYCTACHCDWSRLKARRVGEMGGGWDVATNKIVEDQRKMPHGVYIRGARLEACGHASCVAVPGSWRLA